MNLKEIFYKKLVRKELAKSRKFGCFVNIPIRKIRKPEGGVENGFKINFDSKDLDAIFTDIYSNIKSIHIFWEILDENQDPRGTTKIFKTDKWIKENYLNEGVSWDILKENLSGLLFFPDINTFLGQSKENSNGYEIVGKNLGQDVENWHPIDFHNRYTAFLKADNNTIINNVWLIDLDGREVYDMKIPIQKYFDLAYKAKIFYGWQSVFILGKKSEHFEFMKRFLPKIVPHIDLDLSEFGIKT